MTTYTFTVDYLSEHPEFIPEIAEGCFKEWPIEYEIIGVNNLSEVEAGYKKMIESNNHNTTIDIPIVCFTTVKTEGENGMIIEEKKLCGSCVIEKDNLVPSSGVSPWLTCVFVQEDWRRKGVASVLLKKAIQVAKEVLGVPHLYLWTEGHYGAATLYKKYGFEELRKMQYLGKEITIMRNLFSSSASSSAITN